MFHNVCPAHGRGCPGARCRCAAAPATQPATQPAKIAPEAKAAIDQIGDAYGKLKSLDLAGSLSSEIDAGGQQQKDSQTFTSSFEWPNKFRHVMKEDMIFGSTGEKVYAFLKSRNQYLSDAAPKEKVATETLPDPLPRILETQDPALMLAISSNPAKELTDNVTEATRLDDTTIEGAACPTIKLTLSNKTSVTLAIDSSTHLLKRSRTDLRPILEAQGTPNVKAAMFTIDYTTVTPDPAIKAGQFDWSPPDGAKNIRTQQDDSAAGQLAGKPAPAFKLPGLDGKDVSLADLKGSVVVVDFWATWCGPCRGSLPHLNKIYDDNKEAGLKVFAVDLKEDKDQVQKFVDQTKLTIPVLLDKEGGTAAKYQVEGIPQTVVIGKDGQVKKVFVGAGPTTEAELRKVVTAELKG